VGHPQGPSRSLVVIVLQAPAPRIGAALAINAYVVVRLTAAAGLAENHWHASRHRAMLAKNII